MDLAVAFMGTGGSVPTARRATACVLLRAGGARVMIDCGEGAQRQLMRSLGLVAVDDIYLTHFHADHYLGLPGLLKTYDLHGRERPLRILGPRGLEALYASLGRIIGRVSYPIELVEMQPGDEIPYEGFGIHGFPVEHRVEAYGYALIEPERPGRFDPAEAARLGITDERDFGRLQRGHVVEVAGGEVEPEQVLGEARPGRRVVVTGDTRPSSLTSAAAHGAQLLIHDASFADEDAQRAVETGHSTAREAAELAAAAGVEMLALVHISTRYRIGDVLEEAREVHSDTIAPRDFDLVEIPYQERGAPKLVANGAREAVQAEGASVTDATADG
ncbi:MAG: ribonuclease Z [bacterium]